MSRRVCTVDIGNTAEADILSGAGNDFGTDSLAVFIIANDIGSRSADVLTCSRAADIFVVSLTAIAGIDDYLRAIQSLVKLFQLVRKFRIKLCIVISAAFATEFSYVEMRRKLRIIR